MDPQVARYYDILRFTHAAEAFDAKHSLGLALQEVHQGSIKFCDATPGTLSHTCLKQHRGVVDVACSSPRGAQFDPHLPWWSSGSRTFFFCCATTFPGTEISWWSPDSTPARLAHGAPSLVPWSNLQSQRYHRPGRLWSFFPERSKKSQEVLDSIETPYWQDIKVSNHQYTFLYIHIYQVSCARDFACKTAMSAWGVAVGSWFEFSV